MGGSGGGGGIGGGGGHGGGGGGTTPPETRPPIDPCPPARAVVLVDSGQVLSDPLPNLVPGTVLTLEPDEETFLVSHGQVKLGWLPADVASQIRVCEGLGVTYSAVLESFEAARLRVNTLLRKN